MSKNKFVTECPKCSHEYTPDDINGGRCLGPGCGTMITDHNSRAASTIREANRKATHRALVSRLLKQVTAIQAENKILKQKFKKIDGVISRVYDVLYFDSDKNVFDTNKAWDSAADFMDMIESEILTLLPEPTNGATKRPEYYL